MLKHYFSGATLFEKIKKAPAQRTGAFVEERYWL